MAWAGLTRPMPEMEPMTSERKHLNIGEAIIPGLTLLFGLAYMVQTWGASMTVMRWPYIIAAVTGLLWLLLVVRYVFSSRGKAERGGAGFHRFKKPALMVIVPIIYLALMPYLGFALSTFLFLSALFRLLDSRSWRHNLVIALALTAVLQFALIGLMHMSLPRLEIGTFTL
jgi:hypothetical protein